MPTMLWKLPAFGKISRIGIVPPRPDAGRSGVAIALIVRDEARHIREWAAYHYRAGVRHFLIYDNGGTDGTIDILRTTLPEEARTIVPWRQVLTDAWLGREIHNQVLAYAHAASNFGGAFRWMAFIDADEFLIPTRADSIPAALAPLGEARNLSLPWHMFGRSGHTDPPAGGVLKNYLRRAAEPMSDVRGVRAFKCVVDPCHLTALRVHSMETDGSTRTCNDAGVEADEKTRTRADFYSVQHLQLNHYYTRSESELAAKIGRGPNLQAKTSEYERKVRRTVANIEAEEVEDRTATDYIARIGWDPCGPS
jgi:Glycosyltransferase family 92